MVQLTDNIYAIELTKLGDVFKKIQVLPADNKWEVPYLKYAYRSIYHTKNFEKDFYCGDEIPITEPGSWVFLFTTKEATEERAATIALSSDWYFPVNHKRYVDYNYPYDVYNKQEWSIGFATAKESLQSLLTSKGLNPDLNYAIIKSITSGALQSWNQEKEGGNG